LRTSWVGVSGFEFGDEASRFQDRGSGIGDWHLGFVIPVSGFGNTMISK